MGEKNWILYDEFVSRLKEGFPLLNERYSVGGWNIYTAPDGRSWIVSKGDGRPVAFYLKHGDALRIVACVNAFEGIEDPEEWMRKAQEDKMRLKLYEFTFGILQEMQDAKNQDETKP